MQLIEDMITKGVAGIAVCGINIDALVSGIKKANAAGIPVVVFNYHHGALRAAKSTPTRATTSTTAAARSPTG